MINFAEKGIRNLGGWNVSNVETFGEDDINSLVRVEVRNSQFEDEIINLKRMFSFFMLLEKVIQ